MLLSLNLTGEAYQLCWVLKPSHWFTASTTQLYTVYLVMHVRMPWSSYYRMLKREEHQAVAIEWHPLDLVSTWLGACTRSPPSWLQPWVAWTSSARCFRPQPFFIANKIAITVYTQHKRRKWRCSSFTNGNCGNEDYGTTGGKTHILPRWAQHLESLCLIVGLLLFQPIYLRRPDTSWPVHLNHIYNGAIFLVATIF